MADNYLEFSQVITDLSQEEETWLASQLDTVHVFGDREYAADQVPGDLDQCEADWIGCRAYRDDPDCADYVKEIEMEGAGFEYSFADDDAAGRLGAAPVDTRRRVGLCRRGSLSGAEVSQAVPPGPVLVAHLRNQLLEASCR